MNPYFVCTSEYVKYKALMTNVFYFLLIYICMHN